MNIFRYSFVSNILYNHIQIFVPVKISYKYIQIFVRVNDFHTNIFWYSFVSTIFIRIYSDIRSCQRFSYEYIQIFVRVNDFHTNIFRYLFVSTIFIRIYSDIRWCQRFSFEYIQIFVRINNFHMNIFRYSLASKSIWKSHPVLEAFIVFVFVCCPCLFVAWVIYALLWVAMLQIWSSIELQRKRLKEGNFPLIRPVPLKLWPLCMLHNCLLYTYIFWQGPNIAIQKQSASFQHFFLILMDE